MIRSTGILSSAFILLAATLSPAADGKYLIKTATTAGPKELKDSFRKLLTDEAIQLLDDKGTPIGDVWLRKEVPAKASPDQAKNGVAYKDLEETTLLGAIRFHQPVTDYRKQRIKPGVYTLRFSVQPQDGDHMGTAPYNEFCLLIPANRDESPEVLKDAKELHEKSKRATGTSHPGVLLLFPNEKPQDKPQLQAKENNHWVLFAKEDALAGGQKAPLGIGLTLIGHSAE